MQHIKVWDPLVRVFHWSLVIGFAANALVIDDDSPLHEWVGYGVLGLVAVRLIWGFLGSEHARFKDFPPSIAAATKQLTNIATGRRRIHLGHTPLGALMIYNLLASLIVIGLSGYLMTAGPLGGAEWPDELHEFAVAWTEVSVIVHIAAVVYESWRSRVNLPRAMVTGYKDIPNGQER